MFKDLVSETIRSLRANKVRSSLTVLGIVIGIASVITMISIGEGAKNSVQTSIEGLGSNLLTILPGVVQPGRGIVSSGRGSSQTLEEEDAKAIQAIEGVALVSPESSRRFQIVSPTGNNTNTTVTGATAVYSGVHNITVTEGAFISEATEQSVVRQAVLGATIKRDLFGEAEALGQTIRINKVNFTVIGVLTAKGGAGFSGPDDMIFVPLGTMQRILSGVDYLSTVAVSVADKEEMSAIRDTITTVLMERHRVTEADFSIISQEDILGTLSTVINTFTIFLASIASISLLVGGIGIMNMMLTNVTERTREIGLRKAVGVRKNLINIQFLAEALVLTFVGGGMGIGLGWLASLAVSQFASLDTRVSLSSILLAFGVSATVGVIFGFYPARKAANMNPIDALRYE